ncbi:hypothetical protein [Streptomyces sp. NPDC058308]|uniref:hypothetical protein n=1 Tax=Streptomyces sp. NPDC058308 TaxID=3346440 RepID=UPI0036E758AE
MRRHDGTWTTITDVYWPRAVHYEALTAAGFTGIHERAPLLADAHGIAEPELITARPWTVERETAPFLLVTAQR